MSKKLVMRVAVLAVIGLTGNWLVGCSDKQGGKRGGFPPAVVASTEVMQENWQPTLQSVGSLVATNGIEVSSEVDGIVSEILFTSGQPVEQGQILIKLDASVDNAALEALRAERRLGEVQFNRAKNLFKKRATSKSEYDEAEAKFDAAKARLKQQEEVVKRKIIRAPFAGLAGIREVDLGQYFKAGNPIVGLQALDPIFVDYTLPERYITRIKPGQTVKLKLDAIPGKEFTGEVSAVNSGVDTGTRTLKIRATLPNTDNVLRPGMFAEVETVTDDARPVLTLPRTAISFNTYGNFVFVVNKNEQGPPTVKRTAVKTGEVRGGRVVIDGLSAGTEVVRAGLVKLRDKMPVKIDNRVELNDAELTSQ